MENLGAFLKRERELRKIKVEEIAASTCINVNYLKAIEEGHFEKLPGMAYAKGFLKSYSECVGLDPQETLLRFNDMLKQMGMENYGDDPESVKKFPYFGYGIAFLIVCIAGLFFFWK